ncbi:MAG: helix-turn-helix transcriptional regulator [Treponema sp.]|jgi:predicted transcriptional regulator|nr:helix-turn-helix transcriptional regulator [Treponema sp.]
MNEKLSVIVGNNIKKYRKILNISQEELAEKAGLHRTYIGGIERGERNITLDFTSYRSCSQYRSGRINCGGK